MNSLTSHCLFLLVYDTNFIKTCDNHKYVISFTDILKRET